ncbi:MAG: NfeD family protein [Leptolyngbyaceae cyanobacterium bins.59]|nr:NfeD family protein [Leptolyngbyaceae cyanobacterium bins.59]
MVSFTLIWLVAGAILCASELVLPTAFIAFVMGISALAVALFSLVVPYLGLQVLVWMILSLGLFFLSRRFIRPPKAARNIDAVEAKTLTAILPGATGRVLYEGNSWQARCDDEHLAIEPNQRVYVVGRKGTTLLVLPQKLLD